MHEWQIHDKDDRITGLNCSFATIETDTNMRCQLLLTLQNLLKMQNKKVRADMNIIMAHALF